MITMPFVIETLFVRLAEDLGLGEWRLTPSGQARLEFGTEVGVDFEWDESARVLRMFSVVGDLPHSLPQDLFLTMLEANVLGKMTAGAAFAVDMARQEILLARSVSPDDIVYETFRDWLQLFVEAVGAASGWVAERVIAGDETVPEMYAAPVLLHGRI